MHGSSPWNAAAFGLLLAAIVALAARGARTLTNSGAISAAVMGGLALTAGWSWGVLLVVYFLTASALSHFRAAEKRAHTGGRTEKHGARDATQVLANGGVFAIAAAAFVASADDAWRVVAAAALSASAADTWATEIGVLSRSAPRSILTGHLVPTGTSGGVTALGFLASVGAAAFTAAITWVAHWPVAAVVSAFAGGVGGSVIDSIVGATIQARRHCDVCDEDTERAVHGCGTRTRVTGGVSWMDNDAVNAVCTLGGAMVGAVAAAVTSRA